MTYGANLNKLVEEVIGAYVREPVDPDDIDENDTRSNEELQNDPFIPFYTKETQVDLTEKQSRDHFYGFLNVFEYIHSIGTPKELWMIKTGQSDVSIYFNIAQVTQNTYHAKNETFGANMNTTVYKGSNLEKDVARYLIHTNTMLDIQPESTHQYNSKLTLIIDN